MKTLRIALLGAAAAALFAAADASAQTANASFQVTASVAKNCRVSATNIAITATAWDPTSGANPTQTGTITVSCTKGTPYTIDFTGLGAGYTGQMTLSGGTDKLPYKFYAGNCSTDFTPISYTSTSRAGYDHTICAGLDLSQTALLDVAPAGNYADTANLVVNF